MALNKDSVEQSHILDFYKKLNLLPLSLLIHINIYGKKEYVKSHMYYYSQKV